MYCKECGNEINDNAVICVKCGCKTKNGIIERPLPANIPSRKLTCLEFGYWATGRASRKTYWIQILISWVATIVTLISFFIILSITGSGEIAVLGFILIFLAAIVLGVYGILLTIRRIHDFGGSGWLWLLSLIPYVGFIPMIVFGCIGSQIGANRFGTEPDVTR